jgi:uncharacterized protein (TIGR02679 family)
MSNDNNLTEDIQKAVTFFTHAGLTRLLKKLREKYIEVGEVGGQVIIEDSTSAERRELASFLGKPPYSSDTVKVRLPDVDAALRQSNFSCTLSDVLQAFMPDQPLVTRKERRANHALYQTNFRAALQAMLTHVAVGTHGYTWLTQGQHGIEWLYSRYKNAAKDEQERQLQLVRSVIHAIKQLPQADTPVQQRHLERLALFAQRTTGNPHAFDSDTALGRLFLLALNDIMHTQIQSPQDAHGSEEVSVQILQDRLQELRLYASVGLQVDTVSSSVAVFNLGKAINHKGQIDPLLQTAGTRILLLPLRQILEWQHVVPAKTTIYVCENPQVFEEVVEKNTSESTLPTFICTSGWPSVAALKLLDLLLAQSPDNALYYSGDFDLKGLQIATYFMARYPNRCHLWHFDCDAYTLALQNGGIQASPNELTMLGALPTIFASLISKMQEMGMWAYQEGITRLLFMDMREK